MDNIVNKTANDYQVGGAHYRQEGTIQHWDFANSQGMDYFQGQITKYVTRWKKKNGIVDLEKAKHFLDKYIEIEKMKSFGVNLASNKTISSPELTERKLPTRISRTEQLHPFGFDAAKDI